MKPKQNQSPFSLEKTQFLREILSYIRFLALNKQRMEEPIYREVRSIRRIFEIIALSNGKLTEDKQT